MPAAAAWQGSLPTEINYPLHVTDVPVTGSRSRGRWDQLRVLRLQLKTDHMLRNSLYLILNSCVQAALGFAFWVTVARLFVPADVGKASSLISAAMLIGYLALFGLTSTFVRYLPTTADQNPLITAGLVLVSICGAGMGGLYILTTPVLASRLSFVEQHPVYAVGFALAAGAIAINILTDSIFIANRRAAYTVLTDGGIGSVAKVFSAIGLAGGGAYSLFCAAAGSYAMAALASIVLMIATLRWRPSFRDLFRTLKPLLRFSGANHAGNVLIMLPNVVVPLIVLDRLGAPAAAYYFVSFQLSSLLIAAIFAVEQTFLVEGSQSEVDWPDLLRRSRRLLVALFLPASLFLIIIAHWALLAFGTKYSEHGTVCLMLLSLAAIPIAANTWLQTILRIRGRLRAIVWSSVMYAITICTLAWFMARYGLGAMTAAWPIGSLIATTATAFSCRSLISAKKPGVRGRHRRSS
jgi:O-antigen/teichoic acid export membrane protein